MPTDLGDYVEDLVAELQVPGDNNYPNATDEEWITQLSNAFFSAMLEGMPFNSYTLDEGIITPDLSREFVQIIIFYAAMNVISNQLRSLKTQFRAKAGPVEYETMQSANTLRDILAELKNRRDILLTRLSDLGQLPTYYIDSIISRDESIAIGRSFYYR